MPRPIPVFLRDYDVFGELARWKAVDSLYGERRSWEIRSFGKESVVCRLNWSLRGQVAGLDQAAPTAVEAVWLAIEEFRSLEAADGQVREGAVGEPERQAEAQA